MLIRKAWRIFSSAMLSVVGLFGLSACYVGESGLLDDALPVDIYALIENDRQVFVSRQDDHIAGVLIFDVSPDGTRRMKLGPDEDWIPAPEAKFFPHPSRAYFIAILEDIQGGDRPDTYIPFQLVQDGFVVFIDTESSRVQGRADLLARSRSAVTDGRRITYQMISSDEEQDAIRQAREFAERREREREERAAQRQREREERERQRQEGERQERERQERERQELADFRTDGYAMPNLFEAILRGDMGAYNAADHALYLKTFAEMFYSAENNRACNAVVTTPAMGALAVMGSVDALGLMFGPLMEAHRRGSSGRDQAFGDGVRAGTEGTISLVQAEALGRRDARLFYSRHGCVSPTAIRFFANFNRFALLN